jgi:hypothetical protein
MQQLSLPWLSTIDFSRLENGKPKRWRNKLGRWWRYTVMERMENCKGILVKGKPKFPLNLNQNAPEMLKINKGSNISIIRKSLALLIFLSYSDDEFAFLCGLQYPWGISFSFSNKSLRFLIHKLLMDIKIKFNTFWPGVFVSENNGNSPT